MEDMITLCLTLTCALSIALSLIRHRLGQSEKHAAIVKTLATIQPLLVIILLAATMAILWPVVLTSPGFIFYLSLPLVMGVLYGFWQWRKHHPGAISGAAAQLLLSIFGAMLGRRSRSRTKRRPKDAGNVPASRSYTRALLPSWVKLSLGADTPGWSIVHQTGILLGSLIALNMPPGTLFIADTFVLPPLLALPSFLRWRKKDKLIYGQILEGNQVLLTTGVVKNSEKIYDKVWLEKGKLKSILHIDEPIPGITTNQLTTSLTKYSDHLNAVRTRTTRNSPNSVQVEFYHEEPLDQAVVITEPQILEPKKMRVTCAVNSLGEAVTLTLGDSSGMVIGGIPGSGKTGGATSFLLPLALSEHVDMSIIDGKGGEDWVNYRNAVSHFIKGDTDLVPIYEYIEKFSNQMYERLNGLKAKLGTSNFWNATPEERLAAGVPLKLLVIDECQGVFQPRKLKVERSNGMTDSDMISEITRKIEDLIKRGRSAGIFVILMTQKPTADAMPTAIRDNAGLRIAFHVQTQASEQAILGVTPKDVPGMPSATSIPSDRKGCAVLATDTGEYEMVRFYFMPEQDQENILHAYAESKGRNIGLPATLNEPDEDLADSDPETTHPTTEQQPSQLSSAQVQGGFKQDYDPDVPLPFENEPAPAPNAPQPPQLPTPTQPNQDPQPSAPRQSSSQSVWGGVGAGDVPRDSYLPQVSKHHQTPAEPQHPAENAKPATVTANNPFDEPPLEVEEQSWEAPSLNSGGLF